MTKCVEKMHKPSSSSSLSLKPKQMQKRRFGTRPIEQHGSSQEVKPDFGAPCFRCSLMDIPVFPPVQRKESDYLQLKSNSHPDGREDGIATKFPGLDAIAALENPNRDHILSMSQTIQMVKINKKGEKSFFGSYDTKNPEQFKAWIDSLTDSTLLKKIAMVLYREPDEELMQSYVVNRYNSVISDRQLQAGPPGSNAERRLLLDNVMNIRQDRVELKDAERRDLEYRTEQQETDELLHEVASLLNSQEVQKVTRWARQSQEQLDQEIINAGKYNKEFKRTLDHFDEALFGKELGSDEDDAALEEELEELGRQAPAAKSPEEIRRQVTPAVGSGKGSEEKKKEAVLV